MPFNPTILPPASWDDGQVRLRRVRCGGGGKSRRDRDWGSSATSLLGKSPGQRPRETPLSRTLQPQDPPRELPRDYSLHSGFQGCVCTCRDARCAPISFHSLWSSPWLAHCRSAVPHCPMVARPLWEAGLLASQELVYSLARARRILSETRGCLMVSER